MCENILVFSTLLRQFSNLRMILIQEPTLTNMRYAYFGIKCEKGVFLPTVNIYEQINKTTKNVAEFHFSVLLV